MTRTGAAAGHHGYYHEALCYAADDELLAVVVPFLLGGIAAGEPTMIALGERTGELVRSALPAGTPVTVLAGGAMYARPASAIRAYRNLLTGHVAAGATQIRIIGELSPDTFGPLWDSWARYESAINHAYDDFPLWSMCAYDLRVTPAPVLADVLRTHPRTAAPHGGHVPNADYTEPMLYLSDRRVPPPDPLQCDAPAADLSSPTPGEARQAVRAAGTGVVGPDELEDLVVSVSEAVSNAYRHGRPPVRMRLWCGPGRLVVSVTDAGSGPKEPFAGLLPTGDGVDGGLGLWIAHQSCDHVALYRDTDGFTIRLTTGR
ncbi:transcriptional regulator [Actinoplanes sp. SE50]|uniref:sensor histidine kinase n=1 Tax=unclassified Actinoplanes TaxID=2626549 RepID=UPI00023EBF14|nr:MULTISPECIES: sensor histidine kinase [unclassified Actinoplanes]AEV84551.1 Anti-sigma F factor [Actinoplanes sp. SE50/110]ATO82943.1 transcriptional regulator [Actinoplanes sp. SE50]SLM00351.1 anti-sigma regulatory factor serine/threonine protein kinase [Actinoplanes sp. SE50/110]